MNPNTSNDGSQLAPVTGSPTPFKLEPHVAEENLGGGGVGGVCEKGRSHVTLTSKSILYGTPLWLFRELDTEFHFTTDVCSVPELALCKHYYTPEIDGLAQDWKGNCWMNPPYGKQIAEWMKKAYEESRRGATVVCLVPARVDSGWFHDWVWQKAEIRFPRGRLKFRGYAGRGTAHGNMAPFACLLAIYRPPVVGGGGSENAATKRKSGNAKLCERGEGA